MVEYLSSIKDNLLNVPTSMISETINSVLKAMGINSSDLEEQGTHEVKDPTKEIEKQEAYDKMIGAEKAYTEQQANVQKASDKVSDKKSDLSAIKMSITNLNKENRKDIAETNAKYQSKLNDLNKQLEEKRKSDVNNINLHYDNKASELYNERETVVKQYNAWVEKWNNDAKNGTLTDKKAEEYNHYFKNLGAEIEELERAQKENEVKRNLELQQQEKDYQASKSNKTTELQQEWTNALDKINDEFTSNKNALDKQREDAESQLKVAEDEYEVQSSILKEIETALKESETDYNNLSGAATGGVITSSGVREDGMMALSAGETVLTDNFTKMLPNAISAMNAFSGIYDNIKPLETTTKLAPSININYDNMIKVDGNIDSAVVSDIKSLTNDISNKVIKDISTNLRRNGYK